MKPDQLATKLYMYYIFYSQFSF